MTFLFLLDYLRVMGGTYTIDTQIDSSFEGASYIWYKDGIEIAGEVESTLTVAEPGRV